MAAIENDELAGGTRLPPQRRLAWALGMTVGTVTRAYAEIENAGWVEARVGSGTYVVPHDTSAFSQVRSDREQTDHVDLSLALPPPLACRDAGFREALSAVHRDPAARAASLDYQPARGLAPHRAIYADWMGRLGLPVDADELVVNLGGMHGIHTALAALVGPGARIAAERLTYPGLISVVGQLGLKTVPLSHDEDGLCVDTLASRHDRQPFQAIYVMPEHQNPTAARLSESRRQALAAFAVAHDVWLIEDGVQHLPEAERGTPLYRLAPDHTIFLFSISKILGGGLRAGVMRVPARARERVAAAIRNMSWMPPPLVSSVVCAWLASGHADAVLAAQWQELAARRAMVANTLSGFEHVMRPGGFYAWIRLPGSLRAAATAERLAARGMRVSVAESFCLGSEPAPQALRLCFSAARDRAELAVALDTLGATLSTRATSPWQTI